MYYNLSFPFKQAILNITKYLPQDPVHFHKQQCTLTFGRSPFFWYFVLDLHCVFHCYSLLAPTLTPSFPCHAHHALTFVSMWLNFASLSAVVRLFRPALLATFLICITVIVLWAEMCSPQNLCQGPNPHYFRMWLYFEIGYLQV